MVIGVVVAVSESDPGQLTELEEDGTLATGTAVAVLVGAGTDGTGATVCKGSAGTVPEGAGGGGVGPGDCVGDGEPGDSVGM